MASRTHRFGRCTPPAWTDRRRRRSGAGRHRGSDEVTGKGECGGRSTRDSRRGNRIEGLFPARSPVSAWREGVAQEPIFPQRDWVLRGVGGVDRFGVVIAEFELAG